MKKYRHSKSSIDPVVTLTLIFIVLKVTKLISWSWIWIFSPVWFTILLFVVIFFADTCWWKDRYREVVIKLSCSKKTQSRHAYYSLGNWFTMMRWFPSKLIRQEFLCNRVRKIIFAI